MTIPRQIGLIELNFDPGAGRMGMPVVCRSQLMCLGRELVWNQPNLAANPAEMGNGPLVQVEGQCLSIPTHLAVSDPEMFRAARQRPA